MSTKGKLYLIPSAIAPDTGRLFLNRQIELALENTSHFLAENIREARRFISSLQLGIDISTLHFEQLDKKTKEDKLPGLFAPIAEGHNLGVISDAGCPGVADPGALAVKYAHQHNIEVIPLVGPSSLLLALMGSGLNGQSFAFAGYLPIDPKEARLQLQKLEIVSRKQQQTQLFIETPYRSDRILQTLTSSLQADTLLCIASNLMGNNALLKTQRIKDWRKKPPILGKQPTVFLFLAE